MPGSYEIPVAARELALSGRYDAVICLGAVIRGATAHFDYVAGGAANGISSVALETGIPVIFGVITTETIEQAIERAGTKMGNKGFEAAVSAIEMADLMMKLRERRVAKRSRSTLETLLKASWPATRSVRSYGGLLYLEALRQEVQTHSRRVDGPSWMRTFCRFGFLRRRVALSEWLRALPKSGLLPHE